MQQSIIAKGSIRDAAKTGDVALALLDAKLLALCDRSSSMLVSARAGQTRAALEDDIVAKLQARNPGQVALAAFGDTAYLCPDGVLPEPAGNTNMLDALRLAAPLAEAGLRIVLVTDGEPSHAESEVIAAAQAFPGKIDTIFVGPELSPGSDFCRRLALAAGGSFANADLHRGPELLEQGLTRLLLGAGAK